MEGLKTLVIEDEKHVRELLVTSLQNYCPKARVVGQADGVKAGLRAIADWAPDLVFLDIQLGDGTAFDLLKQVEHPSFAIVFVTAYGQFALQAFRAAALDYLLKPIHIEALQESVDRAWEQRGMRQVNVQLRQFMENAQSRPDEKKLVLKTLDAMHVVRVRDVLRCEAEHNYTTFFLRNGKRIVVSRTLREFEELLENHRFFRSHQSHLVNMDCVQCFEKREGGCLRMEDGSSVPVSKRKREELMEVLDRIDKD
ncbi:MAG: LytTR family DNA-binding domain-containing protein [Bacteroidales bacterium]|nr:LytTR family DNA-binding domain-containing protein [Bacteroidales bacterium]MDD4771465.1 LytTR family DNA-binding domain-containing protein [Bacteroidales bacterium]